MPKKYERIRDNLKKQGKSDSEAKRIAAMTYNKQRPSGAAPVTNKKHTSKKRSTSRRKA